MEEESIPRIDPARIGGFALGERSYLFGRQSDAFGEEGAVDAPFVFTAATRTRPVDQKLSIPHGE